MPEREAPETCLYSSGPPPSMAHEVSTESLDVMIRPETVTSVHTMLQWPRQECSSSLWCCDLHPLLTDPARAAPTSSPTMGPMAPLGGLLQSSTCSMPAAMAPSTQGVPDLPELPNVCAHHNPGRQHQTWTRCTACSVSGNWLFNK